MGCACGTADQNRLRDATQRVEELAKKLKESEQRNHELLQKLDRVQGSTAELRTVATDEELLRAGKGNGGLTKGDSGATTHPPEPVDMDALTGASQTEPLLPGAVWEEVGKTDSKDDCSSTRDEKQPDTEAQGQHTPASLEDGAPTETDARGKSDDDGGDSKEGDATAPGSGRRDGDVDLEAAAAKQGTASVQSSGIVKVVDVGEGVVLEDAGDSSTVVVADAGNARDVVTAKTPSLLDEGLAKEIADSKRMSLEQLPDLDKGKPDTASSDPSTCTLAAEATSCQQCGLEGQPLFLDQSDMNRYCEACWTEYYAHAPGFEILPLVTVHAGTAWPDERLAQGWAENPLIGWPPPLPLASQMARREVGDPQAWSKVAVRVRREVVGPHSRDLHYTDLLQPGEVLAQRYAIGALVGEGHFTKAYLAEDLKAGTSVCLKRHRNLTVEGLTDLMALSRRMEEVDPDGQVFPRQLDAFYDLVGVTVESLIEGRNCLCVAQAEPRFFDKLDNLRVVARDALRGLTLLDRVGVVHNDVKPDNLLWVEGGGRGPRVRIVDFGCARLDAREEPGRNWSLAEGGAGHLGKWSPEMALRLPISTRGDVWGVAVSLCELHCGRRVWRSEGDTAEVVVAQALGICGYQEGLPPSLLRRSPLDIRLFYSPAPRHFPLRRNALGILEMLMPARYGLEQVIGDCWWKTTKKDFGDLLSAALVMDPARRPSAAQLLQSCMFLQDPQEKPIADISLEVTEAVEEA